MDRIDKFLNRRKQKNKKTVKLHNKYYEVTKEDIKVVRKYKKNICLDETVDMYMPYNLKFSREALDEPIYEPIKYRSNEKREQKNFIRKNKDRFKEKKKKEINNINDVWENEDIESIREYKQEILLDIKDAYNKNVDELKLDKYKLEKELRRIFLRMYQPRERKEIKISDILKDPPKKEDLKPYPEGISKYYPLKEAYKCSFNSSFSKFIKYHENILEVYEFRNNVLIFKIDVEKNITKALFNVSDDIIFSTEHKFYIIDHAIDKLPIGETENISEATSINKNNKALEFKNIEVSFYSINRVSKGILKVIESINRIRDFDVYGNLIVCISNRNIFLIDKETNGSKRIYKVENEVPLNIKLHKSDMYAVIGTTSSIIVYDIVNKSVVSNSKIFNYVMGFSVDNFIYVINNLKRIIVFDYKRNIVLNNMLQEHDVFEIEKHRKYNLLAVSTRYELLIFYVNTITNQYVLVSRFRGKHTSIKFHSTLPWLYSICNDRVVLYT